MTSFQRTIRDLANIFAIILIVGIFTGVTGLLFLFTGGVSIKEHISEQQKDIEFSAVYYGVEEIDIELASAKLAIFAGNELKVETNDNSVRITQKKNKLKIEENAKVLSVFDDTSIIIYLPEGAVYDKFKLESGAGTVSVEKLTCDKLNLEIGAGKTQINYLQSLTSADIEVGTGEIKVLNSDFNNLDIEVGVGEGYIAGTLTGRNALEVGIGELEFVSAAPLSEYTVKAETGIGEFKVDGNNITDNTVIGDGANILNVSGGIGSVEINFAEQ